MGFFDKKKPPAPPLPQTVAMPPADGAIAVHNWDRADGEGWVRDPSFGNKTLGTEHGEAFKGMSSLPVGELVYRPGNQGGHYYLLNLPAHKDVFGRPTHISAAVRFQDKVPEESYEALKEALSQMPISEKRIAPERLGVTRQGNTFTVDAIYPEQHPDKTPVVTKPIRTISEETRPQTEPIEQVPDSDSDKAGVTAWQSRTRENPRSATAIVNPPDPVRDAVEQGLQAASISGELYDTALREIMQRMPENKNKGADNPAKIIG